MPVLQWDILRGLLFCLQITKPPEHGVLILLNPDTDAAAGSIGGNTTFFTTRDIDSGKLHYK